MGTCLSLCLGRLCLSPGSYIPGRLSSAPLHRDTLPDQRAYQPINGNLSILSLGPDTPPSSLPISVPGSRGPQLSEQAGWALGSLPEFAGWMRHPCLLQPAVCLQLHTYYPATSDIHHQPMGGLTAGICLNVPWSPGPYPGPGSKASTEDSLLNE